MSAYHLTGQLHKEAARGDQMAKLLARLGGSNLNSLLFRNKIIRPGGTVRGVEGWQSSPVIGQGPGGVSHHFSGKPTEHAISELRGGELIKQLKETLPSAVNERGGGMWLNEQKGAADLIRQIRNAERGPTKLAASLSLSDVKAMLPGALGDSAVKGGLGGAALGGIVGAGQAVFDGEDDGMGSTLGKILGGAGKGAVGGAVVGGGVAAGKRHMAKNKVEDFLEQLRASVKARQAADGGGDVAPKYPGMILG